MATYALKLYRYKATVGDLREGIGTLSFDAGDDATAIRYADSDLSEPREGCDYAVLFGPDGRIVKEWGKR